MPTVTTLELELEKSRQSCEQAMHDLNGRFFASWFMSDDYGYFQEELEYLMELIDETLGLIAISGIPLRRTEKLSKALIEDGLSAPTFSIVQSASNQGAIAHELSNIWQGDVQKLAKIEKLLFEFNQSLRDMQRKREQSWTKWLMDWFGFPAADSLPQTLSMRLLKELFDPDVQSPSGHTIIEVPQKRLARQNTPGVSAWPLRN